MVLGLLNAGAAIVVAAARQNWPEGYWTEHAGRAVAAIAITIAVPLVQLVVSEVSEKRGRKAVESRAKLETFLTASLIQIVRNANADWETTGIQVFVVRRIGLWRAQEQIRAAKVRLGAMASSGVRWPKGKGVIGRCWETRRQQYEDLDRHFAAYKNFSRQQWDTLSKEARYGLTYDDFQRLNGKYGIVAAVPIVSRDDKYLGCITADMPPRKNVARNEVLKSLTETANLVKEVI